MNPNEMTLEEIEALSNYNGNMVGYTGLMEDGLVQYNGTVKPNFVQEFQNSETFTLIFSNQSNLAQEIIFNRNIAVSNPNRVIRDGIIPYAVGATDLTCTATKNSVAYMLDWLDRNPTTVLGMQIETSTASQFSFDIFQQPKIFTRDTVRGEVVKLARYKDQYATNEKLIRVNDQPYTLDYQTETTWTIPPLTITTVILSVGLSYSVAQVFRGKRMKADSNPVVRGAAVQAGANNSRKGLGLPQGAAGSLLPASVGG